MEDENELETPGAPKSAMTSEEMIAMALTALAPALIGGAVGGKAGMYGGAAVGSKAAGGIAQNRVEEDKEAAKVATTAKAKEAARQQNLLDQKGMIEYRAEVEGTKVKPEEYIDDAGNKRIGKMVGGKLIKSADDSIKEPPKPDKPDKLQQTQFLDPESGLPLVFNPKSGQYESGSVVGGTASKRLSASDTKQSQGGKDSISILDNLETSLKKNGKLFGPVSGRIGGANPYDTEAQTMRSELKTSAQIIGKYMEGGVLRKEDEAKYEQMLPNLNDTQEVAAAKLKLVRKMLADKSAGEAGALKGQGYDVRGIAPGKEAAPDTVTVTDGNETLIIPKADLAAAQKDGFKEVQ